MKKIRLLFLSTAFLCLSLGTYAQVTIGSGFAPINGALLDLKDQEADTDNVTAKTGGLLLPRVKLTVVNDLVPFITGATATQKKDLIGVTVYNINSADGFNAGSYTWNGSEWKSSGAARNGLSMNGAYTELGGNLIQPTTITASGANQLFLDGLDVITSDAKAIVIDQTSGQIGYANATPATLAFFQSAEEITGTSIVTTLNAGSKYVVPWAITDQVTNTDLVELDSSTGTFTLLNDVMLEMSGYVCFQVANASASSADRGSILLNAAIEVKRVADTDWSQYSLTRVIWANDAAYWVQTMQVPPALFDGKQGDQIRFVVQRPSTTLGGSIGYTSAVPYKGVGLVKPTGAQFSKGLKLLAVG